MKLFFSKINFLIVVAIAAIFFSCSKKCKLNGGGLDYHAKKEAIEKEISTIHSLDTLLALYHKSVNEGDKLRQMLISHSLGKKYRDISDFSAAIRYNSLELDLAKGFNDTSEMIHACNSLGTNFRRIGAFSEAMNYHNTALELVNQMSDTLSFQARKNKTVTLNGIGNISITLGYYEDAKRLFFEALNIEKSLESHIGMAINYANLGSIYHKNNDYDSAMWYYQKSYDENVLANSNVGISLNYNHFGNVYEAQGKLNEAAEAYQKAYEIAYKDNDIWHRLVAYISLGRVNLKLNDWHSAQKLLNEALEMAKNIEAKESLVDIYELFYKYYKLHDNNSKALHYFELSRKFADSVCGIQNQNRFMETRVSFERNQSYKKETFLIEKHQKQVERTKIIVFLSGTLVLMLIIAALLLRRLQIAEKHRANALKEMDNVKNKFFSIISHDLRGNAITISNSLKLLNDSELEMSEDTRKLFVEELCSTSDALVELLESLLSWAKLKTGRMEFNAECCSISQIVSLVERQLHSALIAKGITINTNYSSTNQWVEGDFNMLSAVIRNLLSNAVKFSYPNHSIEVTTSDNGDGKITVDVTDHGIGMTQETIDNSFRLDCSHSTKGTLNEKGTGLGLIVCAEMLDKHQTKLRVKSAVGEGSSFSFDLKKCDNQQTFKPL